MSAPSVQLLRGFDGRWTWRILSANGRTVARSEQAYARRADAIHSLELVTGGMYCAEEREGDEVTEDAHIERRSWWYLAAPSERLWVREVR